MKKLIFLALLIVAGCSLNAEQEASLNTAIRAQLKAMNEGQLMTVISNIHPSAVRYYMDQGDEAFKSAFELADEDGVQPYFQDPTILKSESSKSLLHVKFKIVRVEDEFFDVNAVDEIYFAISEDNGKSWHFLREKDYKNEEIIKASLRLIN